MKKMYYLWILPIASWVFVIALFVNLFVFSIVFYDELDGINGVIYATSEVVLFILFAITSKSYSYICGNLRKTQKIVRMYMSKYFNEEKIEFKIQNEIYIDEKTIDTIVTFGNMKLKFSTIQMFNATPYKSASIIISKKTYENFINIFNLETKTQLMRGVDWQNGRTTTLSLYKDDVEVKSQLMPMQFPFIYLNYNEFRAEMNKFLNRESINPDLEWKNPLLDNKSN